MTWAVRGAAHLERGPVRGGRIWRPQNEHPGTSVITSFGHRHHCRVLWVCSQARLPKVRLIPAPPKS